MDGTHLTQAGQVIVADYIYSLLVAPSEMSFLAETAIQTTFQTIAGIQQQIVSRRTLPCSRLERLDKRRPFLPEARQQL